MAEYLRLPEPPLYTKLGSRHCELAVTHLDAAMGYSEPARSIPAERAFSIHLHLRPTCEGRLWLGGRLLPTINRLAGGVTVLDLEEDPVCFFPNPSEVVQFYIPRLSLEEFSYENRLPIVDRLACPHGGPDNVLHHLGFTVLSMMRRSETASKLFLDHLGLAVLTHVVQVYGVNRSSILSDKERLSPWQARRARDILMANIGGDVTVSGLAAECGLSVAHFARAFRGTFGKPPHRWLLQQRIEQVKCFLLNSRKPLSEIALHCGFADQPALNRAFRRVVGESPGEWRRSRNGHS
jgi:AraC family transcriptional regulator